MTLHEDMPYVRLRALELEDLDTLYLVENDESIWGVSNTNVPYSRSLLLDYITTAKCDIYADKQVRLMVENHEGKVVGMVDIVNFQPQHLRAELGIVIRREFLRQHYATAILQKILLYSKEIIHLHQLYAIVDNENLSCLSLLEKAGFQKDTLLKDWLFKGGRYVDAYVMQKIL